MSAAGTPADVVVPDRGRYWEDFGVGQAFAHHWGRTLTAGEAVQFATSTMNTNPLYFNAEYARARGHKDLVVDPLFVWNVVFGLSVEDLSFKVWGAGNLGYPRIAFEAPAYPGDTVTARSEVLAKGEWGSGQPDRGVVHVHTEGFRQDGARVVDYERKILVQKRPA